MEKFKCPVCNKKLRYVSQHLVVKHKMNKDDELVKEYWKKEYERDKRENKEYDEEHRPRRNLDAPPHWYFPISYKEMRRRRMRSLKKALKDMGLTLNDLKNMRVKKK